MRIGNDILSYYYKNDIDCTFIKKNIHQGITHLKWVFIKCIKYCWYHVPLLSWSGFCHMENWFYREGKKKLRLTNSYNGYLAWPIKLFYRARLLVSAPYLCDHLNAMALNQLLNNKQDIVLGESSGCSSCCCAFAYKKIFKRVPSWKFLWFCPLYFWSPLKSPSQQQHCTMLRNPVLWWIL